MIADSFMGLSWSGLLTAVAAAGVIYGFGTFWGRVRATARSADQAVARRRNRRRQRKAKLEHDALMQSVIGRAYVIGLRVPMTVSSLRPGVVRVTWSNGPSQDYVIGGMAEYLALAQNGAVDPTRTTAMKNPSKPVSDWTTEKLTDWLFEHRDQTLVGDASRG